MAKTYKLIGNEFTIKAKNLLIKLSLLNIETILKGKPNKEVQKAKDNKNPKIGPTLFSAEVNKKVGT